MNPVQTRMVQNLVRDTIIGNNLLSRGDRCIVACSGGADSMALLHILMQLNNLFKVSYRVVHVHHGLRGEEADRDAEFVQKACERYNIPCRVIHVEVQEYAEKHKLSLEEAARILRYKALKEEAMAWEREADTDKLVKIAAAHNKQDNAETILMQLARGSGLKGLGGIDPKNQRIIRPLLEVNREEIEEYLQKEEVEWVTDSTNLENTYTRNRVRHEILPKLVEAVNSGAVDNITRAGRLVGEADDFVRGLAQELIDAWATEEDKCCRFPTNILLKQKPILQKYIVRLLLEHLNHSMKNITARNIENIAALANAKTGKKIDLPYRMEASRGYEELVIRRREIQAQKGHMRRNFEIRTFEYHGEPVPEDDPNLKWFDNDKIGGNYRIRRKESGDYIELKGVGKKSVRSYMTDAKIPMEERAELPIIAVGHDVIWIVGYRISERYKVDENTRTALEIRCTEVDTDGGDAECFTDGTAGE